MKTKNDIYVIDFNDGLATLHLPLGFDIIDACKKVYLDLSSEEFLTQLKKHYIFGGKLKTITFNANGIDVCINIEDLVNKSYNYIYFMWLKEYFMKQAGSNQIIVKLEGHERITVNFKEMLNTELIIKNRPDEDYLLKYDPYVLYVVTLIAKVYYSVFNSHSKNGNYDNLMSLMIEEYNYKNNIATTVAYEVYKQFENSINHSFDSILEEIKLYILSI